MRTSLIKIVKLVEHSDRKRKLNNLLLKVKRGETGMTPRELRLLIAVAFLIGAAWWFISLTNACMTWLRIFSKGNCISVFSLNFGATTFWFYNLLAVLALYAAFHLYKTLPTKDLKPEHLQDKQP